MIASVNLDLSIVNVTYESEAGRAEKKRGRRRVTINTSRQRRGRRTVNLSMIKTCLFVL